MSIYADVANVAYITQLEDRVIELEKSYDRLLENYNKLVESLSPSEVNE